MSNEVLSLPVNVPISLNSLEPGTTSGDVMYWNGVRWVSAPVTSLIIPTLDVVRGTALEPAYAFSVDDDTGIFSSGENTLDFSTAGSSKLTIDTVKFVSALPINGPTGSAAEPAYTFFDQSNVGMFSSAINTIDFSTNSTKRLTLNTLNLISTLPILCPLGTSISPAY